MATNRFGGAPLDEETEGSNRFGGIAIDEQTPSTSTIDEVPERSFLEMGGDFATSYGIGSNALLKMGGDLYGLATGDFDNWASEQGARGIEYFENTKSDTLKTLEKNRQAKVANADGEFAKAGTMFWETVSSPSLFAAFAFEQAPLLLSTAGTGAAVGAGVKIAGATASTVAKSATAGAITAGGVMQGADVGSDAYEKLLSLPDEVWAANERYQARIAEGMTPEAAKAEIALPLSRDSAMAAGLVSLGLNMIPGAAKLEKALVGVKRSGKGGLQGFAKGFAGEATAEGLEEGYGALRSNIAAKKIDPSIDITKGVGEAAGMGAAAGFFGGAAGVRGEGPKSNRAIIDELDQSLKTIAAAPTVDAAIDAANVIIGSEVGIKIKAQEPSPAAAIEPTIGAPIEVEPDPTIGGTFGGLPIEPTAEVEPAGPPTEEERISAEVGIQSKARARIEEEQRQQAISAPQEALISELTLSKDVPQFKAGATKEGVVEPLGGTFDRAGVGPIQVWVRKSGAKEVITGRHRLDLAKRSGMTTIPAQLHYEAEGFDVKQAKALDATLNIREGQGQVKDYINFIKETDITPEQAESQGILARSTGQQAFTIAKKGSELLIDAHSQGIISDPAAVQISEAAPNNEALQVVGLKAIENGKPVNVAVNMVKAVSTMAPTEPQEGDLFGFDTGAIKQAEELARAAAAKQATLQRSLSAVQGATKNPELAAREGVNVDNPAALKTRITALKAEKAAWAEWHTNPKLVSELKRGIEGLPPKKAEPKKVEPKVQKDRVVVEHPIDIKTFDTFKTAKDAVDWLATSAKDPVFKAIAKSIQGLIGTDIGFRMRGSGKRKRSIRRGVYETLKNRYTGELVQREVGIYTEGMQEATLTHELIHAATVELIDNPKTEAQRKAVIDLKQVQFDVNRIIATDLAQFTTLTKEEQNAFQTVGNSLKEFVTYSLTNPGFQSALKKLTFKGERQSIFNKLSDVIKQLLGLKEVSGTVFARALEASSAVVESATKVTASKPPPDTRTKSQISKDKAEELRKEAYKATLKASDQYATKTGYVKFINDMKAKYKQAFNNLPKNTIQGRADFTQFIQAQVGQMVSLSDIKLTRKITDKDGKIQLVQGAAETVLRQTRKKRDMALKLLRCIQ